LTAIRTVLAGQTYVSRRVAVLVRRGIELPLGREQVWRKKMPRSERAA